jgi:hypothetical protein
MRAVVLCDRALWQRGRIPIVMEPVSISPAPKLGEMAKLLPDDILA